MTTACDTPLTERRVHDSLHDDDIAHTGAHDIGGARRRADGHVHSQLDVRDIHHSIAVKIAGADLGRGRVACNTGG
jgi:hypothetical protein